MAETDVSTIHIYKLLIEVKTTLDLTLKQIDEHRAQDNEEKEEIFSRINNLEKKMAQVVIIAVVISMALPIGINVMLKTRPIMQPTIGQQK
tara:strand:- start:165 stop:437 length:273 start_codon:yes stop_codon:yes gene_type:complete